MAAALVGPLHRRRRDRDRHPPARRPEEAGRLQRADLQPRDGAAAARAGIARDGRRLRPARTADASGALVRIDWAARLPGRRGVDQAPADPDELPRQRRGTTPQMHGRYPDFDVLENASHWDETTRKTVLDRVENVPPIRFFSAREAATADALCDILTAQDREPRIPVVNYVDEKLHDASLDGYQ